MHIAAVAIHVPLVEKLDDGQAHRTSGLAVLRVLEPESAPNRVDLSLSNLDNLTASAARHGDQADDVDSARIVFGLGCFGEEALGRMR
ncbi:hypothetical protein [Sphingobium lactosutens]|uniref:Uncharacterized protein n=1 Tax=Sphingobium lactosutens DS20 TaxID=1331060 RepID=T0HS68_9SPHN|nr:hypothetical protein [Sphingobium lactosutens]EQB14968.1 hypothetical protein RLDS_12415 [Sphingobium lactosutens DS20]